LLYHDSQGSRAPLRLAQAHNRALAAVVAEEAEVRTAATLAVLGKFARLGAEMLGGLEAAPGDIPRRELTVMTGVAIDKLARWERWGETPPDPGGGGRILDRIQAMIASGASLELTISRRPECQPA
jgi:hypothetical protein